MTGQNGGNLCALHHVNHISSKHNTVFGQKSLSLRPRGLWGCWVRSYSGGRRWYLIKDESVCQVENIWTTVQHSCRLCAEISGYLGHFDREILLSVIFGQLQTGQSHQSLHWFLAWEPLSGWGSVPWAGVLWPNLCPLCKENYVYYYYSTYSTQASNTYGIAMSLKRCVWKVKGKSSAL